MRKKGIATFLTAIIETERFCDGTIAEFLEDGIIVMLLERLAQLEQ
jgi:hypothetical protein